MLYIIYDMYVFYTYTHVYIYIYTHVHILEYDLKASGRKHKKW